MRPVCYFLNNIIDLITSYLAKLYDCNNVNEVYIKN